MSKQPAVTTLKRLFAVSGNICAFPNCSTPLVDPESGIIIGEICHIHAREEGGPRYDPNLTPDERNRFNNLILMCGVHHKIIDTDKDDFPADRLFAIKEGHEKKFGNGTEPNDDLVTRLLLKNTPMRVETTATNQSGGQIAHQINNYYQQQVSDGQPATSSFQKQIDLSDLSEASKLYKRVKEIYQQSHSLDRFSASMIVELGNDALIRFGAAYPERRAELREMIFQAQETLNSKGQSESTLVAQSFPKTRLVPLLYFCLSVLIVVGVVLLLSIRMSTLAKFTLIIVAFFLLKTLVIDPWLSRSIIRSKEDVERVTKLPVLAVISRANRKSYNRLTPKSFDGYRPLIVPLTTSLMEQFRRLRHAISHRGNTILMTGILGNEGCSTVCANLAIAMAHTGAQVILVDLNLREPRLHLFFDLTNDVGFTSVLVGEKLPLDALQSTSSPNLRVLTSGPIPPNATECVGSQQSEWCLSILRNTADYVFIDAPPAIPFVDSEVLARWVDFSILTIEHKETYKPYLEDVLKRFNGVGNGVQGIVLNKFKGVVDGTSSVIFYEDYWK